MAEDLLGTTVGHIRIVERLAKGGTGEVYVGRDEQLKRKVALKAIRDELKLDHEAKARLLREARILSRLEHPNICRIYDYVSSGFDDFLVLELIGGKNLRQALEVGVDDDLKMRVALAVAGVLEAAHGQGVIHRDLKPENVMITPAEGTHPERIKVLDFGLARRLEGEVTATLTGGELGAYDGSRPEDHPPPPVDLPADVETRLGRVLGTLGYMSPEQAQGQPVTAATDMYSLGLLLQELFTGRQPFGEGLDRRQILLQAARAETLPVEGVDTDLKVLIERLKSPLPSARPAASEAAERLRQIRDKPRRTRRRRLAWAAVVFLALIAAAMSFQAWRISREASRANREAAAAQQVTDFVVELFGVSDPLRHQGDSVTAREILDYGAAKATLELADQPLTQARVMQTIASFYHRLGLYQEALPLVRQALEIRRRLLGDGDLAVAESRYELASLHWRQGDFAAAEPLYESALATRERLLAGDHPDLAASLNGLAILHWNQGRYRRAEPLYLRALEIREAGLGPEAPEVAASLDNLAILYKDQGRDDQAKPLYRRSLALREKRLGPDHPEVATSLSNLGELYREQGRAAEAEPLYRRAVTIWEAALSDDHPALAVGLTNLATVWVAAGRYAEAEPLFDRAIAIFESTLGPQHPYLGYSLQEMGKLHAARGEPGAAGLLLSRALTILAESLGAEHPDVGRCLLDLAAVDLAAGRREAAEAGLERAAAIFGGSQDPEIAAAMAAITAGL